MLPITLTGILSLVFLAVLFLRNGLVRNLTSPYTFICVAFFRFFGFPTDDSTMNVWIDCANLLAFVSFSTAYFVAQDGTTGNATRFFQRLCPSTTKPGTTIAPFGQTKILVCLVLLACYVLLNFWVASVRYGGLDKALVRFYSSYEIEQVSPWLMRISYNGYNLALLLVFVLRLNHVTCKRGFTAYWVALGAILLVAIPQGSAGRLLTVGYVVLLADCISAWQTGRTPRVRISSAVVVGCLVLSASVLLSIRGRVFDSPGDVVDLIRSGEMDLESEALGAVGTSHTLVQDYVGFSLTTFGESEPFLWFHTPYTILVNPIPREIWPSKPLSFGATLLELQGSSYEESGVSFAAGLAGEGYANGGHLGIVVLSVVVGFMCGKAAKYALVAFRLQSYASILVGILLFKFSTSFVRGDMLSAWTQNVYPLVMLVIAIAVFNLWRGLLLPPTLPLEGLKTSANQTPSWGSAPRATGRLRLGGRRALP